MTTGYIIHIMEKGDLGPQVLRNAYNDFLGSVYKFEPVYTQHKSFVFLSIYYWTW